MEKGILKLFIFQSIILLCLCISWSFIRPAYVKSTAKILSEDKFSNNTEELLSECSGYLKIQKAEASVCDVTLKENPVSKEVQIFLETNGKTIFHTEPVNIHAEVKKIKKPVGNKKYNIGFLMKLDSIYVFDSFQDKNDIYIRIFKPNELYKKIIVIDAGHGGIDSGTQTDDKKYQEKDINLAVAQKLGKMLQNDPSVKVFYTRTGDQYLSPQERLTFINEIMPDICISIHCNSSDNLNANGIEVLYSTGKNGSVSSKNLASACLKKLVTVTGKNNRGLVNGKRIYIIRNSKVPLALVELGFISNAKELKYLRETENQQKLAEGIYKGIKQTLE